VPRFGTAAAIAAFRTWLNDGFIPHARHGGIGKAEVAVLTSKFEGTGLEKEHMGQIHVPADCLTGDAGTGMDGLLERETGDEDDERYARDGAFGVFDAMRRDPKLLFSGLGYKVILADDRRNPA
jgi:hypothetical protein